MTEIRFSVFSWCNWTNGDRSGFYDRRSFHRNIIDISLCLCAQIGFTRVSIGQWWTNVRLCVIIDAIQIKYFLFFRNFLWQWFLFFVSKIKIRSTQSTNIIKFKHRPLDETRSSVINYRYLLMIRHHWRELIHVNKKNTPSNVCWSSHSDKNSIDWIVEKNLTWWSMTATLNKSLRRIDAICHLI